MSSVDVVISTPAGATDYADRSQSLRAALLGANDGLVSTASLMIGVGAVNSGTHVMLLSGIAALLAGACSMGIGEFISVYAQYEVELKRKNRHMGDAFEEAGLPSPTKAAITSFITFASGSLVPLLSGAFIEPWSVRLAVVCTASCVGLIVLGAAGAFFGHTDVTKSVSRTVIGGLLAMSITFGVLRLFREVFDDGISAEG